MESDPDPARIATVIKLACKISRSWDLGRPFHCDIERADITATAEPVEDTEEDTEDNDESFGDDLVHCHKRQLRSSKRKLCSSASRIKERKSKRHGL
jgi:hypothetical protein